MDGNLILDKIEAMVSPHKGIWTDSYRILITGIMSTRTKDEVTDRASLRLFCKLPHLEDISRSPADKIEALIKPVGFYKTKSRHIMECSRMLLKKFHGKVPDTMKDLLSLPGVGRKVANIVLSYGIGKDALAVDTHVQRVSFRLGLSSSKIPEVTESHLRRKVKKERWNEVNSYFVSFGREICKPISPKCNICSLRDECKYWRKNENSN